jgi:glycerol-3-phosphate acyltransferase PlsX
LGTIPGVDLPALAPVFPTATGTCIVLDIGANPEVKPENLVQFGIMGSIYAQKVRGVQNPKVGLVSNGEEEGKGNNLVKEATPLLKDSGLNFYGNVEGKEVIGGVVDVAVTDGLPHILLKSASSHKLTPMRSRSHQRAPLAMLGVYWLSQPGSIKKPLIHGNMAPPRWTGLLAMTPMG